MYEEIIYFIAFWVAIVTIYNLIGEKYQKYLDVSLFILIIRTTKINKLINKLAFKFSSFWKSLTTLEIVTGFLLTIFVIYFLLQNLIYFFIAPPAAAPIQPLIPGITISLSTLWYLIIPLVLVVVPHEFFHGLMARVGGIRLKSAGIVLFLIIPGAFVEVDEKELPFSKLKARLAVYAGGSFINIITGIFALLMILNFVLVISPMYHPAPGILITDVVPGSPADGTLQKWDVLYSINGTTFTTLDDFYSYMNNVLSGQTLILNTSRGVFTITAASHPQNATKGFIGIAPFPYFAPNSWVPWAQPAVPYILFVTLNWTWLLGFNLAIFNMLPFPPLDGDKFIGDTIKSLIKNKQVARYTFLIIRLFSSALLFGNLLLTFLNGGFIVL